jgi:hypothetical protein
MKGRVTDSGADAPMGASRVGTLGHDDEADPCFDQAMVIHERFQAPFFLARTLLHRAELSLKRAGSGDAERATELLGETLTAARRHGYAGLERAVTCLQEKR